MIARIVVFALFLAARVLAESGSKVTFDAAGNARINGKPFFPIGVFSYSPDALEDMRKHGFNSIVATTEHHKPEHLDLMSRYGLNWH